MVELVGIEPTLVMLEADWEGSPSTRPARDAVATVRAVPTRQGNLAMSKLARLLLILAVASTMAAQDGVLHQGRPALKVTSGRQVAFVEYVDWQGEPAFKIQVQHYHFALCNGYLYISRNRVEYHPLPNFRDDSVRVERGQASATAVHRQRDTKIAAAGRNFTLVYMDAEWSVLDRSQMVEFAHLAIRDFDAAEQQFMRLTAALRAPPAAPAQPAPLPAPVPKPATLKVRSEPGAVQIYVDDVFKGISSTAGNLVVESLSPGTHQVRLSLIGYKEWKQEVELTAGESKLLHAKLEPVGPKPLSLAEIEEALSAGVATARVAALIKEYGVDFSLTDEAEQRLRGAGADDALILAVLKAKR